MSLTDDLLEQAEHLAKRELRRPRQASLRRAVSVAYYAVFHRLAGEGAALIMANWPRGLRQQIQRAFVHGEMKTVCKEFAGKDGPNRITKRLLAVPLEPELVAVATAFVVLQEARHAADYDLGSPMNRLDVNQKIALAKKAFRDWEVVSNTANARVFLAALLLQNRWNKA